MVSYVCLSSRKKSPLAFSIVREEGEERPQQNFCFDVGGFPPTQHLLSPFQSEQNRYFFTNGCSQIRPFCHHFLNFRGRRGGGADHCAKSLPWGFLFK